MTLETLAIAPSPDFALLDSGDGRKWERCGRFRFIRPEPQALWRPRHADWPADGEFVGGADDEGGGRWNLVPGLPPRWEIAQAGVALWAAPTPFRHFAFFPDMAPHWARLAEVSGPGVRVLNLFAYTGVASLVAARAGAEVVHVDASRKSVAAARANAELSGLADAPVRWIVDDARAFVAREQRRGRSYQAILLDPPKYGRGPDGEVWDLSRDLPALVRGCAALLAADARLMILTSYAVRLSALALGNLLAEAMAGRRGEVQAGEMALVEEGSATEARLLPTAIFARWQAPAPGA